MTAGLSIGDLSARTGLAVSAIRFYETHDIIKPVRNKGGHRRYGRHDIRRLSFVLAAQKLGFSRADIAPHLRRLPDHKAPSKADWTRIGCTFRREIDARIWQVKDSSQMFALGHTEREVDRNRPVDTAAYAA